MSTVGSSLRSNNTETLALGGRLVKCTFVALAHWFRRPGRPTLSRTDGRDYTVVVLGDDPSQWPGGLSRGGDRQTPPATELHAGLPAGRYPRTATDALVEREQWNPQFLG